MARPIADYHDDGGALQRGILDRSTTRSTARAFAAAITALAISTLVITTSSDALVEDGTIAETHLEAGTIEITDDDDNRALFSLEDMSPNEPTQRCIRLLYQGTMLPADLTMVVSADGPLAPYVITRVESGAGGRFDDCTAFEPDELIHDGTLADLAGAGRLEVGGFLHNEEAVSFRITVELADDQEAVDKRTTVDFQWEVAPR